MSVRAKFYVESVTKRTWADSVRLQVVTRGEDNKVWSAATPTGHIEMNIKNDAAAEQFVPGREYFVTFEEVPAELAGAEGMGE